MVKVSRKSKTGMVFLEILPEEEKRTKRWGGLFNSIVSYFRPDQKVQISQFISRFGKKFLYIQPNMPASVSPPKKYSATNIDWWSDGEANYYLAESDDELEQLMNSFWTYRQGDTIMAFDTNIELGKIEKLYRQSAKVIFVCYPGGDLIIKTTAYTAEKLDEIAESVNKSLELMR